MYGSFHLFRVLQKVRSVLKIQVEKQDAVRCLSLKAGALGGGQNSAASGFRGDPFECPEMNPKAEPYL